MTIFGSIKIANLWLEFKIIEQANNKLGRYYEKWSTVTNNYKD